MADISKEINDFKTAIYGKDVRDSMVSMANKLNSEVESSTEAVQIYGEAEVLREQAEIDRQTAENSRTQEFLGMQQLSQQATNAANEAAEKAEKYVLGDISEKTVTFQMAAERANIQSNDSLAVAFAKLSKFCSDLQEHAFSALVNNGLTTETGKYALDAAYGKSLRDDIDKVNSRYLNNAGAHNAIYRGKNLGTSVTAAQYAAISAGTFEDLYIGDYWVINGVNWRIAAFDYYINCGDTSCTKHHVVIVPDTCLYNHVMNDTNITTGGYVGSKMYTEGLEQAKTTIKAAFSGHVLSHRVYLISAVTDGYPSGGAWCDSEVDLMNEQMVYGGAIFMPIANGSTVYTNYRVEKSQLPLFAHEPSRICNRVIWWLRDVVTASYFAFVVGGGYAACDSASYSLGVRPSFCIS